VENGSKDQHAVETGHLRHLFPFRVDLSSIPTCSCIKQGVCTSVYFDKGTENPNAILKWQEELEMEIDTISSIIIDYPTVKDLRGFFMDSKSSEEASPPSSDLNIKVEALHEISPSETCSDAESTDHHSQSSQSYISLRVSPLLPPKRLIVRVRPANSVVLQGRPWLDPKTLILFPDGARSASSYARLPRISPSLAVVGLSCPYAQHPEEMSGIHFNDFMDSYLTEVRRRQSFGPYHLVRWSSGDILTYCATQRLFKKAKKSSL
jgi:hypothetical protein